MEFKASKKKWWHEYQKKYIELKENHAYYFYFFKTFRDREEPVIIVERPVILENGIYYNKLFPEQWEIYEHKKNITTKEVIYHEDNKSEFSGLWILNDKVYKATRVRPDKIKSKLKGFERISIFDLN